MRGSARRVRPVGLAVVAGLAAWLLLSVPQLGWAAGQLAFRLDDDRIIRSTGLARDLDGSVYWTANRAGGQGRVYAVDDAGETVGTLDYRADPQSVQALAYARDRLYVGDIGDPDRSRDQVTVYVLSQPTPDGLTVTYNAYDFSYPDGPHDAATLLVDPSGRLLVITREAEAGVYAAGAQLSTTGVNRLRRVADAPAWVTDGTVLTDGRIVLRTYVSLLVLDADSYAVTASAPVPVQPRGESVVQPLAGDGVLLGSVGSRPRVLLVPTPTTERAVPSAGPTPPGPTTSAAPSATASAPAATAEEDTGTADDTGAPTGTLAALGLAALVAVAAGCTVGLVRGRR